jgi:hypothetical protein
MIPGEIFRSSGRHYPERVNVLGVEGMFMAKKVTVYSQPG